MVASLIFVIPMSLFSVWCVVMGLGMAYDHFYYMWDDKRRGECDCRTPRDESPWGSTFICDLCARKWYSTWDDFWSGWALAPWWKRIQMRLGWERKGRRKVEDPIAVKDLTDEQYSGILEARERIKKWMGFKK